ncbi:scarecrow-like protein 34 isoform X2 [Lolium rigidum]|uniref:scarecrow-like protein 34 isoform X2 n=1 Tax=Lolium rigidum TaxID=89674 RepID=UPI001F5E0EAA|nr:scarecrow-like protein 34 isoform X2 [Lolium rigidum]
MAATPEQFLLRDGADFLADAEPLSPSLFLDLPPTPAQSPPRAASPDDHDLDFISRMLMEEDIDEKFFYQYPDHPAILSAQHPFQQIISDSATSTSTSTDDSPNTTAANSAFSSDSAADKSTSSSSDDSATNAGNSTSSDSAMYAPASPAWPYDPIELAQLLRSPPYIGLDSNDFPADNLLFPSNAAPKAGFFEHTPALPEDKIDDSFATAFSKNGGAEKKPNPLLNSGTEKQSKQKPVASPAADAGQDVLASAFFSGGQTDSDMEMLNMAFRKGMEEANKFLPTNNALLLDLDTISDNQMKKEEADTFMFRGGRGRKNRHGMEDLEAEAGRNSKLMAPEQEEMGSREMVDEIMLREYEICMQGMEDLRIAMGSEAEKNSRKGTGKGTARGKRGTTDEVVDLRTMLIHCAQAVATGDRRGSNELLRQIKQHSSPKGDATQRLAHCFAQGLEARLAGTGSQIYQSLVSKRTSVVEYLKAYKLYMAACSFKKINTVFVGKTIMDAMEGKSRLHIVDYNVQYGFQWPGFFRWISIREGGPPEVRITGIDLPQPGFRPAFQIEETGRRLSNVAREFGVPFKFHGIVAKLETVRAEDLNLDPDEVLVVTSQCGFSSLMDESADMNKQDSPSPRDMVLSNIRKMRPHVFIDCIANGTYGAPFFITRFREALFFYSALFDMLDATIPRDNEDRQHIERDIIGRCALNVIACEGADRVDRPETYKQWQVRSHRAGLRQLPLNPEVVKIVKDKVKNYYHKDFVIDVDHRWLLQGWKGRILYAMSAWVAAEDDNSKV